MARPKVDDPKNRRKILAVAEKIFASKGFDATRVDDIAAQAHVNKALIYYYFKSKSAILEELYNNFIELCAKRSEKIYENLENILSEKFMHNFYHDAIEFMENNTNLLRIIMIESMKKTRHTPLLLKTLGTYSGPKAQQIAEQARQKGIHVEGSIQQVLVTEFFTKSVPIMFFILFHEAWINYFGVKEKDLKEWFIAAIESTHMAHHHAAR
jgi:AcrR family transcriptional regulator